MEHPRNLKRNTGLNASLFLEELRPSDFARAGILAHHALERMRAQENDFKWPKSQNRVTCLTGNAAANAYLMGLCGGFRAGAWFVKYDYDNAYRLKSLITKNTQGDIIDGYSYLMDAVGNRTSMTSLRDNQVTSYEYDETYRLTKATYPWANFEQFSYDIAGNRQTLTDKDGITTYGYDDANRLLNEARGTTNVSFTWDNAGNMLTKDDLSGTTTYEWNYDSRLIRSTVYGLPATSYCYDPSGIRVRITEDTVTKRLLYSNEDIIAEFGGASEMYYVHGPLIDEPLAQLAGTTLSYMHRDGLGSVTAFSNNGGQLAGSNNYTSFGTVHETSGVSSRYGYTSRELDDSGLMYHRSRYYQPEIGRFLNQDYYQGDQLVPPSLHRYIYTNNNPIHNVDSSGKNAQDIEKAFNWLMSSKWGGLLILNQEVVWDWSNDMGGGGGDTNAFILFGRVYYAKIRMDKSYMTQDLYLAGREAELMDTMAHELLHITVAKILGEYIYNRNPYALLVPVYQIHTIILRTSDFLSVFGLSPHHAEIFDKETEEIRRAYQQYLFQE